MTTKAQQRAAAPKDYWRKATTPLTLGREQWRAQVIRGNVPDILVVDNEITDVTWADTPDGPMTGTITLARVFKGTTAPVISNGHLFILSSRLSDSDPWTEVWRMRCKQSEVSIDGKTVAYQLEEDTAFLSKQKRKFRYGKGKGLPKGPRTGSIVRDVAKDYGFRIGEMYPMKYRVKSMTVDGSPMDVIIRCIKLERNEGSGRRLIWRWRNGKLDIVPLQRSSNMLLLGPAIAAASYTQTQKEDIFCTALRVRGSLKSKGGKKRKKTSVLVESKSAIARYGYILKEVKAPKGVDTVEEARKYARASLLRRKKVKKEVTFSHPGVSSLRRWDAIKLYLPEVDMNVLCYVNTVTHSVSAGSYTMDVGVRFSDPFVDTRSNATKLKRCKKLKKRGRKLSPECVKLIKADRAKTKKKKQRT